MEKQILGITERSVGTELVETSYNDLEVGGGVLAAWGFLVSARPSVLTVLTVYRNQVSEVLNLGLLLLFFVS